MTTLPPPPSDDTPRRERVKAILMSVVAVADGERAAFLERSCGDDLALLQEVRDLLRYEHDGAGVAGSVGAGALSAEEPATVLPGMIGPYRIERVLGMGGMGTVYLGREVGTELAVALKVVRHAGLSTQGRHRFQREAEALRRLEHAGIARIHSSGVFDGDDGPRPYLALEYVEGRTLREVMEDRAVDPVVALTLLAEVADALDYAHGMGVVHRDLKPENIMVDGAGRPRLLDFGVARLSDSENPSDSLATRVGHLLGTVQYMSPEQAAASGKAVDGRSDIYSLGVIAYEWLGGAPPYPAGLDSLHQAVVNILMSEPALLGELNSDCRGNIELIVARALAKKPEHRFPSAGALAEDIRRHLRGESIAPWEPAPGGSSPGVSTGGVTVRRRPLAARVGLVLLGVGAVALISWGAFSSWRASIGAAPISAAEHQRRLAALYSSLEDADRKLHRGSRTEAEIESGLAILDAAHVELAGLPALPYGPRIEYFIQWRTGEGHYFLGSMRRDPGQFSEALAAWDRAREAAGKAAPLAGIDTTLGIFPEIARLGLHHPYAGMGMACEALADFNLPKEHLVRAMSFRGVALTTYEATTFPNYDVRYPPSQLDRELDHALLLNDFGGSLARYGALLDSLPLIDDGLAALTRADSAWTHRSYRSPYGAFLYNMGSVFRQRGELSGRTADFDSADARLLMVLAVRPPSESPGAYSDAKMEQAAVALARARQTDDVRRKNALLSNALGCLSTARTVLGPKHDGFAPAQLDLRDAEIRAELAGTPPGSINRATRVSLLAEADSALARAGAVLTLERYPLQHAEVVLVQGLVADARWRQLGEAEDRPETLAALGVALEQIPESSDPHMHQRLQRVLDRLSMPEPGGSRR